MAANTAAALVTGANKGIGLEIVRQLSAKFQGTVYLTARDNERGKAAETALNDEGLHNVKFLHMDVLDRDSIDKARDFIKEKHGGLDILINNAGIAMVDRSTAQKGVPGSMKTDQSAEAVKKTIDTNFTGLLDVCKAFFPILREHARVVNVASNLGNLKHLKNDTLKEHLKTDTLTVEDLEQVAADCIRTAEKGNPVDAGYPEYYGPYTFSKILVNALSRAQQRDFDRDSSRADIVINSCCPGFVATDLNNNTGTKTTVEGADTPVYLATLPPASREGQPIKPRGEFVFERKVLDWLNEEVGVSKKK